MDALYTETPVTSRESLLDQDGLHDLIKARKEALRFQRRQIAVLPEYVERWGAKPALVLSQCEYWTGRGSDPEGWFWKTVRELAEELRMKEHEVRRALEKLIADGVLEVHPDKRRSGNVPYYRVNLEKLLEILPPVEQKPTQNSQPEVRFDSSVKPVWRQRQTHSIEYTENTFISDRGEQSFPRKRENLKAEEGNHHDPAKTTTLHYQSNTEEPSSVKGWVTKLFSRLNEIGAPVDDRDRQTIPGNMKKLITKYGATPREMALVVAKMVEARGSRGYLLSPQKALGDVRGSAVGASQPDNRSVTPEVGIEALRNYVGRKGQTDLREFAPIAERWDFTRKEDPPENILKLLARRRDDQWETCARIRTVVKRAMKQQKVVATEDQGRKNQDSEIAQKLDERLSTPPASNEPKKKLIWFVESDGKLSPVSSEEVSSAIRLLQEDEEEEDAARVFLRYRQGRLSLDDVILAASHRLWGEFEPPTGYTDLRSAIEELGDRLAPVEGVDAM